MTKIVKFIQLGEPANYPLYFWGFSYPHCSRFAPGSWTTSHKQDFAPAHITNKPWPDNTMIRATELSTPNFRARFPNQSKTGRQISLDGVDRPLDHKSLLNDTPPAATSCLVYNHNDLKAHTPDPPIYSIPIDFQPYRELRSRQAVFKTLPGRKDVCIFSHMFISPEDVEHVFGKEFIQRMSKVQELVRYFLHWKLIL